MRTINISTEVFAEIWKRHQEGEQTEDQILRRIFKVSAPAETAASGRSATGSSSLQGYEDARFGVKLPEGFEIFRIYKGRDYRAKATGGNWLLLNDKTTYPSLHKLSWAIVKGHENTWFNWKFKDATGTDQYIHALRDQDKVGTRS